MSDIPGLTSGRRHTAFGFQDDREAAPPASTWPTSQHTSYQHQTRYIYFFIYNQLVRYGHGPLPFPLEPPLDLPAAIAKTQRYSVTYSFPLFVALCDHNSPTLETDKRTDRLTDRHHAFSISKILFCFLLVLENQSLPINVIWVTMVWRLRGEDYQNCSVYVPCSIQLVHSS